MDMPQQLDKLFYVDMQFNYFTEKYRYMQANDGVFERKEI